jgi:hypothetical protein
MAIVINEKEVLEAKKKDQIYMVRIKVGTEVLARMEKVVSVRPKCCSDSTEEPADSIARTQGGTQTETGDTTITCVIRFICFYSYLEKRWRCAVETHCDG